jgi:hypothetical protein
MDSELISVLNSSPLTTFFLGLSPILCLILLAQSICFFKLGYRKLAFAFLIVVLLLGTPALLLTYALSTSLSDGTMHSFNADHDSCHREPGSGLWLQHTLARNIACQELDT